ncbi:hypothetical protein HanRHA438_Chr08g0367261 [Helianthus annuus]|nr:hypothetical protein HanRHA438_Chr08g0367261 [Helianthus annuus]
MEREREREGTRERTAGGSGGRRSELQPSENIGRQHCNYGGEYVLIQFWFGSHLGSDLRGARVGFGGMLGSGLRCVRFGFELCTVSGSHQRAWVTFQRLESTVNRSQSWSTSSHGSGLVNSGQIRKRFGQTQVNISQLSRSTQLTRSARLSTREDGKDFTAQYISLFL